MNVSAKLDESRFSAALSPIFEEDLPPTDHQKFVEEPWSLALKGKVEFQNLEDSVEVKETIHNENAFHFSSH